MKFNCNHTTYIDKFHSHTNFSESNSLLIGAVTHKSLGLNLYLSILNFHLSDLNADSIKEAYLFLFIEDIKYTYNSSLDLGLCGSYENVDIFTIDWSSFPKNNFTKPLTLNIFDNPIGSYLKVDVTSIIRSLANDDINCNIILNPINTHSNAIVKLASAESNNPPYLNIITDSIDNTELSDASENETYDGAIEKNTYKNTSNSISNNIALNQSLIDNMDSFSKKLINIDSKLETLDRKTNSTQILISSLNSEILKLTTMFHPLTDNVKAINTNMDNLKNDINSQINSFKVTDKIDSVDLNSINSQLSELSSNLNSLIEIVNHITIEPLN